MARIRGRTVTGRPAAPFRWQQPCLGPCVPLHLVALDGPLLGGHTRVPASVSQTTGPQRGDVTYSGISNRRTAAEKRAGWLS